MHTSPILTCRGKHEAVVGRLRPFGLFFCWPGIAAGSFQRQQRNIKTGKTNLDLALLNTFAACSGHVRIFPLSVTCQSAERPAKWCQSTCHWGRSYWCTAWSRLQRNSFPVFCKMVWNAWTRHSCSSCRCAWPSLHDSCTCVPLAAFRQCKAWLNNQNSTLLSLLVAAKWGFLFLGCHFRHGLLSGSL